MAMMKSGEQLLKEIKLLRPGKRVYLRLSYGGWQWFQRWTKAGARQLAGKLRAAEKTRTTRAANDTKASVAYDDGDMFISVVLE